MPSRRIRIEWTTSDGRLTAIEPDAEEVRAHAHLLAEAYNEPHNRSMMGHEEMTADDVADYYAAMGAEGGRLFLLFRDGALVGDADLRHMADGHAEFAIMIGARRTQGKGLGTRFALMLHAFAFRSLRLERVFVTILVANSASRRLFEKLGYQLETTALARSFLDDEDDLALSIGRTEFEQTHRAALTEIEVRS